MKKNNFNLPVGVIDVGSNSVRLMIADGIFNNKNLIITRLGSGFLNDGSLSAESMLLTVNAIKELKTLAENKGVKTFFAFATAAVRKAKNQKQFTALVKDVCGLELDVVSGDLEAELAVKGALKREKGVVIDIGGASSEIAFSNGEKILLKNSYNVGAVTLFSAFKRLEKSIDEYLDKTILKNGDIDAKLVKAVGGTATSLAVISLGLKKYNPSIVNGHYISKENLIKIKDYLYSVSPEVLAKTYAVESKRAEVIAGGASILLKLLTVYDLEGVTVSESDNLEGYLDYLKGKYEG